MVMRLRASRAVRSTQAEPGAAIEINFNSDGESGWMGIWTAACETVARYDFCTRSFSWSSTNVYVSDAIYTLQFGNVVFMLKMFDVVLFVLLKEQHIIQDHLRDIDVLLE